LNGYIKQDKTTRRKPTMKLALLHSQTPMMVRIRRKIIYDNKTIKIQHESDKKDFLGLVWIALAVAESGLFGEN
jgi:predicted RNase H-like nuclease